jgi:DotD protein
MVDIQKTSSRTSLVALSGVAVAVFLSACTSVPSIERGPDPAKAQIEKMLSEVDSLPAHSSTAEAQAAPARLRSDLVTIRSYVGDASNLLSRFAKARSMTFKVTGPEPHLPLLVTVDVDSVTMDEFLSQVSYQFGQRATLILGDKRLEIRYRGLNM